ncbi:MAG TPA: family 78 glycoside hydrolase catalytic domain, partial [Chitinophaga sp.]
SGVSTADRPKEVLVATVAPPVKKQESFRPLKIFTTPKGEQVVDFGQNLAGWVQLKVRGKAGDTITLQHAEMLDKEGNFYTGNLRGAAATDQYILSGKGEENLEPHFTWHGFRYAKITGCDARAAQLTAVALYSDMAPAGSFACSDPRINQLQHNISWSLKSNFLDVPTDCPQRSERLGWTGDAQVFFRTASFHYNVAAFFTKWLADLQSEQYNNGALPNVIPNIYHRMKPAAGYGIAGWGDAAVLIPWQLYWVYNDTAILRAQYSSMKAWVQYIRSVSRDDCWQNNGYGDWLAPGDSTSLPLIDQCYWAHSTALLAQTARLLGQQQDAAEYDALLQRIKAAFSQHYLLPGGKLITDTQTAYVLALTFHLLPDSLQAPAAARLAALVAANGNHLATGFLGTPFLLHALSNNGYSKTAYDLLLQDNSPSWLYPVKMGATTIWEKWNAVLPDSTVQATSFNHYSYGAVGDWLYRVVAGIDAASPGYGKIVIRPTPGGGLTWVKASYRCPYGTIVSNWKVAKGKIKMQVAIPAGATATVYVPGKAPVAVGAGSFTFEGTYAPS